MKKKAFAAMAAALLLTGCSNPFDKNDAEEAAVTTTAPVTTTEAPEIPTATLQQKMIYLRMGDDESAEPFLTSDHITDCSMEIVPDQPDNSTYVVDIFYRGGCCKRRRHLYMVQRLHNQPRHGRGPHNRRRCRDLKSGYEQCCKDRRLDI